MSHFGQLSSVRNVIVIHSGCSSSLFSLCSSVASCIYLIRQHSPGKRLLENVSFNIIQSLFCLYKRPAAKWLMVCTLQYICNGLMTDQYFLCVSYHFYKSVFFMNSILILSIIQQTFLVFIILLIPFLYKASGNHLNQFSSSLFTHDTWSDSENTREFYLIGAICCHADGCHTQIPFVIMTSDDTNALTIQLLESNSYFGMEPSQVKILKQVLSIFLFFSCAYQESFVLYMQSTSSYFWC